MTVRAGIAKTARLLALGPLFYLRRAPVIAALLVVSVLFLTALTQVGGVLLWLWLPVADLLFGALPGRRSVRRIAAAALFVPAYLAVTVLIVPPLAAPFGRVPLPCWPRSDTAYGALTITTCLLNRHYAAPEARAALSTTAVLLAKTAPGRRISYLDAGFPFFSWFPMLPHLSHGDGRGIDLALLFVDPATGGPAPGRAPSPIGYWGYVQPQPGAPLPCAGRSSWRRWDLAWLQPLLPGLRPDDDGLRTLLNGLGASPGVDRVYIEAHLRARLGIAHPKIRFQGCGAARHDDHIHVEFR